MNDLPPWITLRALAVELCPKDRQLNSFKDELRRILKEMGIHRRPATNGTSARYWLSDMMDRAPQLVSTWEEVRARNHSGP